MHENGQSPMRDVQRMILNVKFIQMTQCQRSVLDNFLCLWAKPWNFCRWEFLNVRRTLKGLALECVVGSGAKLRNWFFLGTIYLWNVHANNFLQFYRENKIWRFSFSSLTQRTYLKWKKSSIQFSHNLMKFMRNAWYECQIKGNAQHPSTKVILLSRTASFDRESV